MRGMKVVNLLQSKSKNLDKISCGVDNRFILLLVVSRILLFVCLNRNAQPVKSCQERGCQRSSHSLS
jgi:hypothetical protein